ncbi:MAG: nucleotidyltransferase domain-containing protein [Anaerolineae bacterium]|nr:nucleotidyltransferase domain-containing protein [Anaerolineae bacterium]
MADNEKIASRLRQLLPDILGDTPVTLAYLYGSVAAGQSLPMSDVDVALVLCRTPDQPELSPKERFLLELTVQDALEQHGIRQPDVRVIDDMPLPFRGQVATSGVRLYSRDEFARVEFETRTWKEYLDFEPVARMMRQALFDDVRERGLVPKEGKG